MSDQPSDIIQGYLRLLQERSVPPQITAMPLSVNFPLRDKSRPCALLLSPHPDDECLTGALPLRLRREQGWQIINIAVTLGSDPHRREARKAELAQACTVLNFDCVLPEPEGFSQVLRQTREEQAPAWQRMVARLADIIAHLQPQVVLMPHTHDGHPAHSGTYLLGTDALAALHEDFSCTIIQSEYWHPLAEPNLMVGVNAADAAVLLAALACHAGENARNPFDARFPAYLIDNVRRGSERVGGDGAVAAAMDFAMLYRVGGWKSGRLLPSALSRLVPAEKSLTELFSI